MLTTTNVRAAPLLVSLCRERARTHKPLTGGFYDNHFGGGGGNNAPAEVIAAIDVHARPASDATKSVSDLRLIAPTARTK